MLKVAIEPPYTDVQAALREKGYEADMIDERTDAMNYEVVVVGVQNQNVYTASDVTGSLVEAQGRTVDKVVEDVIDRLDRMEKIKQEPAKISSKAGAITAGAAAGAIVGAAAGLLLTPKGGKELQTDFKEKVTNMKKDLNENEKIGLVKNKAASLIKSGSEGLGKVKARFTGSKGSQETPPATPLRKRIARKSGFKRNKRISISREL